MLYFLEKWKPWKQPWFADVFFPGINVSTLVHTHSTTLGLNRKCSQSDERTIMLHPAWYRSTMLNGQPCYHLWPGAGGGGARESGLTPLTNTSATVCVCVCIPVVIITQIRAEPNPHRVFSPQSCPPADCPAQFSPACSSGPAVWAWMGSRAAALTSPPCLADRQMDKALTHAPFFKIPDISNPLFLLSIAHSPN